jgi:hypothetical protein
MVGRTAARAPELVEFTFDDRRPVVTVMRRLLRERDGWINVQPAVNPEILTADRGIARVFSAMGPTVPLGTWMPGDRRRNGTLEPVSLGLQHAAGPRAIPRLRELGYGPPDTWRVLTDHSRRGFVLLVPSEEDPDQTLAWLVRAAIALAPFEVPVGWRAGVFHRR